MVGTSAKVLLQSNGWIAIGAVGSDPFASSSVAFGAPIPLLILVFHGLIEIRRNVCRNKRTSVGFLKSGTSGTSASRRSGSTRVVGRRFARRLELLYLGSKCLNLLAKWLDGVSRELAKKSNYLVVWRAVGRR